MGGTVHITGVGIMYFTNQCDSGVAECVLVPLLLKALLSPQWLASKCGWTHTPEHTREQTRISNGNTIFIDF